MTIEIIQIIQLSILIYLVWRLIPVETQKEIKRKISIPIPMPEFTKYQTVNEKYVQNQILNNIPKAKQTIKQLAPKMTDIEGHRMRVTATFMAS